MYTRYQVYNNTLCNARCIMCRFVPSRDDVPRAASDAFRLKVIASKETGSAPPVKLVRLASQQQLKKKKSHLRQIRQIMIYLIYR